jgi:hypothetical protein
MLPGLVPLQPLLVHQQAHQLRDRDRRVRVVELDLHLVREVRERLPLALVARMMSCSVAETKKYCCLRRSSLPAPVSSGG